MYAIIISGGKQYKAVIGSAIILDFIDLDPGCEVTFNKVVMIQDGSNSSIGMPHVFNGKVTANIMQHSRDNKVSVIKFKRRKYHMKHIGHRQWHTTVRITGITGK